jgi:DNA invertase Pin-like site-specific DNA recombinase
MVEVIAMFSNRSDQGRPLRKLLHRPDRARKSVRVRTQRKTARRLEKGEVDAMVEAYRSGSTVYELATQFRVHRTTVGIILEREGVPRRYRLLSGEKLNRAVRLYGAGRSLDQVAEDLGVNHSTVALALRKSGVQLRPRPGWTY